MKKNIFFWFTAAVIIAALVFTGCSSPSGGTPIKPTLTGITVTPASRSIGVGQTASSPLVATPVPSTAALGEIEWSSDDTSKVTVSATGVITGVAVTDTPVKVYAKSKAKPGISGFSSITVTEGFDGSDELTMTFIAKAGSTVTTPTLPTKDADNTYTFEKLFDGDNAAAGNWASATGFDDVILVYPDRVLNGDFKLRARVKITDASANSASKGIIVGAFAGLEGEGDFETGNGGTVTTGINLRSNGALRNLQSRTGEKLAATALNATVANKEEEFIYEVIRDETGITTNTYISKNGEILSGYSTSNPIPYTNAGTYIQGDTPVYAGIALAAVAAKISQVELWDGDLDGDPVFYTGDSTAAPVPVTGISITVADNKGTLTTTGVNPGTSDNPAQYYVTQTAAAGSLDLEAVIVPAYADVPGAKFFTSTVPAHPKDSTISVNENTGEVIITGTGSKTIQAISNDQIGASYFLTINVTSDYVPVGEFNIVSSAAGMLVGNTLNLSTDINFALVTDPEIVWTTADDTTVTFIEEGTDVSTVTGPTAIIKGLKAGGDITITATATTTDGITPTVKIATKQFTVTSAAGQLLHWKFDTLPDGWTEGTNAASPYNVDTPYGDGLILRAGNRTQMIRATGSNSGAPSGSGFSDGCIQPGGAGIFATLGPVTGPFTVTINYGGSGSNPGRYPMLLFSSTVGITGNNADAAPNDPVVITPQPEQAPNSDSTSDYKTYTYTYTPNPSEGMPNAVYVHFSANNGLRFFDIKVQL